MAKIKDFNVGVNYAPYDEVNSILITRKIEKLKMQAGTGEWDKKWYFINNPSTNGICHPVYQELFETARKTYTDKSDFEVSKLGIPKSASKQIGVAENIRCTFNWGGMKFDNASIVIIPGERYTLPLPAIAAIRRFLESKNITPDVLGLLENEVDGVYYLTDTRGIKVEVEEYDTNQLEY